MKSTLLRLAIVFVSALTFSCQKGKTSNDETLIDENTSVTGNNEESSQSSKSDFKLSCDFENAKFTEDNDENVVEHGLKTSGEQWNILLYAESVVNKSKKLHFQFKINDFNLTPKKVTVEHVMLIQSEVENEMDMVLNSKTSLMEITKVDKIHSETTAGLTINTYNIDGTFSGTFKNSLGSKEFEVKNGIFKNARLTFTEYKSN